MIALDEVAPPPETRESPEVDDGAYRCTLCLSWHPADEMVRLSPLVVWCTTCALRYPELVPPPADVFWPVGGFLTGALVGCLMVGGQSATQIAVAAGGLIGAIAGTSAGICVWALRTWRAVR